MILSRSMNLLNVRKNLIFSYSGKLLEIVGSRTLVVGVDDDDKPFVLECPGRLTNALDFSCETFSLWLL